MRCIYCKFDKTIRCGYRRTKERGKIQRYKCKRCNKKFIPDDGFKHRKKSPDFILENISLWLAGLTFRQLAQHFQISKNSCLDWVLSYADKVVRHWRKIKPGLSVKLHLDELFLHMKNTFYYIWDSISAENRFCTLHLEKRRGSREATSLIRDSPRALKIVTDGSFSYQTPVRGCFGTAWYHENFHQCVSFEDKKNNNLVERLQNTLRRFLHPRRGFHRVDTGRKLLALYEIYLNFVRKHMALGCSPAEKAGLIKYPGWIKTEKQRLDYLLKKAVFLLLRFSTRILGHCLHSAFRKG
ncbi:MAG: DDE-type integrase/transposase/recombinase [Candidatus Micrarchaeota archaeon]